METLLCPTDFSPEAENALRYAGGLGQSMGPRLVLFHHIYEPVSGAAVFYEGGTAGRFNLDQEYRQAVQEKLEALYAGLQPGADCATSLHYGLAKDTLPRAAGQVRADLPLLVIHHRP